MKKNMRFLRSYIRRTYVIIMCTGAALFQGCNGMETEAPVNSTEENNVDNRSAMENPVDKQDKDVNNADINNEDIDNRDAASSEETGPQVSIVMVGDILLHTPVAESGQRADGSYCFDAIFANVRDEIAGADLALVNEEVIIGGSELGVTGYPSFNAPYELGDALSDAGFDAVLHATNHALDRGKTGIGNCLSFWKTRYPEMAVLGINESKKQQDEDIFVFVKDGIRIAVLNYTYGTNGIPLPSDMPYAVNLLEEEKVKADLERAEGISDFVIVCPHWGTEYSLTVSKEQEYWTEIFMESGADLVIGTHPHVIGPVEWVKDGNGHEMLVYYSLGNFVNWTSASGEGTANRMVGGMAQVTVGKGKDGRAFILDYGIVPLVCHLEEGYGGVKVYPLSDYSDELAGKNAIVSQDPQFSLDYCEKLCDGVWGEPD